MARKVTIVLEDDLDGGAADESVAFALDGIAYEIDLSRANAARLRDAMEPFIKAARKAPRGPRGRTGRGTKATAGSHTERADPQTIRAWAGSNGIRVSERGRIPADVVAQFEAAN